MTLLFGESGPVDEELDAVFQSSAPIVFPTQLSGAKSESNSESVQRTRKRSADDDTTETPLLKAKVDSNTDSDEDDASKTIKNSSLNVRRSADDKERNERTVFVGNLPVAVLKKAGYKQLKTAFSAHGEIESIRFRSIAFAGPMPRKVAFIKGLLHPEKDTLNAYIVFKSASSVQAACAICNGMLMENKHIRVDCAASSQNHDRKKSVFVGNLPFDIQDETVRNYFSSCGDITNVRIIRDKATNLGKGFGYVSFKERSSATLALQLDGTKLEKRKLRVQKCSDDPKNAPTTASFEGVHAEKSVKQKSKKQRHKK